MCSHNLTAFLLCAASPGLTGSSAFASAYGSALGNVAGGNVNAAATAIATTSLRKPPPSVARVASVKLRCSFCRVAGLAVHTRLQHLGSRTFFAQILRLLCSVAWHHKSLQLATWLTNFICVLLQRVGHQQAQLLLHWPTPLPLLNMLRRPPRLCLWLLPTGAANRFRQLLHVRLFSLVLFSLAPRISAVSIPEVVWQSGEFVPSLGQASRRQRCTDAGNPACAVCCPLSNGQHLKNAFDCTSAHLSVHHISDSSTQPASPVHRQSTLQMFSEITH